MRLLHVFPGFNTGGSQVRFTRLAGALGDDFHHTVLSLNGDYEAARLVPPQVSIRYLDPPAKTPLPRRLLQYRRVLRETRPDLLLTYNWGAMEFALARRLAPCPHLHHEDGFGPEEVARQLRRRIWLRRIALSDSHLLAPSKVLEGIARETWGLHPARVHYVANGVPIAHQPQTTLESLGFSGRQLRIVWVGGLRAEKNPLRLLEAFAPLRDRAALLILGDGPERGAVKDAVNRMDLADRVHMLGNRTDARDLLAQCDILALSSDTEQMPLVVLEAMAAWLPVASVDVGDVRRMVSEENQPYVTPLSAEALGQALRTLVDNPELRRRVGEANRRRAQAVYNHDEMAANHRALILHLVRRPARPREAREATAASAAASRRSTAPAA